MSAVVYSTAADHEDSHLGQRSWNGPAFPIRVPQSRQSSRRTKAVGSDR
jgi:hypothetical protein